MTTTNEPTPTEVAAWMHMMTTLLLDLSSQIVDRLPSLKALRLFDTAAAEALAHAQDAMTPDTEATLRMGRTVARQLIAFADSILETNAVLKERGVFDEG